ncbi:GNAT family N-acetyltransferase [Rhizomonospora bruguierae]|uniref:GNAT family N-acetyltransferase n=1 Tax=Rhizomonospora bruguierae TaxID=1581705 RepID=UPI001BCD0D77|nr:GNAT family N-acetyltransferase [Micromonospora sp. NBRC 107566]
MSDSGTTGALLSRLETFYDAAPRDRARVEDFGSLLLFVNEGPSWPFYARPASRTAIPDAADIMAVRARQRELGLPEAFEWVHDLHPDLLAVARSAGLVVLEAPLLVLDPDALPAATDVPVRLLDPAAPAFPADVAARRAVAAVGFAAPGTARAAEGPDERDAALAEPTGAGLAHERQRHLDGRAVSALVEVPGEGAVASGYAQALDSAAEIVGVATLPAARRRGYAATLTAALARRLLADGVTTVFLSAGSDDIARVYARVGFRRVGTACIAEPTA